MADYDDWDPNPYVGEVQLKAFMSFMRNQLRWNNAATFVETKWEDNICVRGSHSLEYLFTTKNKVMQGQEFVTLLEATQDKSVNKCKN